MNFQPALFAVVICSLSLSARAQSDSAKPSRISLNGYVKNLQNTLFVGKLDSNLSASFIHNRLNFSFDIANRFSGRLEIRNRIYFGEQIRQTPGFSDMVNRDAGLLKLSHLWIRKTSFVAMSGVDRMLLNYADDKWNLTIGRQRINWGINNIWNPNDIFNAYNFLDFDYEERPGNDALRVQRYFNDNSTLEFAYAPARESKNQTAALLYKFNKSSYDFQLLGGVSAADYVLGGGWAGNIRNAGFKGEMSYFFPLKPSTNPDGHFSLSLMADKTFQNNVYFSVACLYNSRPSNSFNNTGFYGNAEISAKNLFPFRYNFYATLTKTISPITILTFSAIFSPQKNTLILVPVYSWNAATNFDVDFTAQSFFESGNHDYKNLMTQLYLRSRWSF